MDTFNFMPLVLFIVPVLTISVLLTFNEVKENKKKENKFAWHIILLYYLFVIILPLAMAFISYKFYEVDKTISIISIIVIVIIQLIVLLSKEESQLFNFGMIILIIFPLFILIFLTPKVLSSLSENNIVSDKIDISQIEKSFSNIESSFYDIDKIIESETSNINKLISQIKTQIESKNQELKQLNEQQNRLLEEVEHYKKLSSINREQADALLVALNRNKYLEYIIGFAIGILSSLAAGYIFIVLMKRKTATNKV